MGKVLMEILKQLEMLIITGKDAERMTAIKSMVRDLLSAVKAAEQTQKGESE